MKHGYLISAYKNGNTVYELIKQFDDENNFFYIHIDKKSRLFETPLMQSLKDKSNVTFLKERIKVKWGGFSHLEAIVLLIREGLKNPDISYFHLFSDSCFPIKPPSRIDNFFEKNNGKEFMEYFDLPTTKWAEGGLNRLEHFHLHDIMNLKGKINRRIEKYFTKIQKMIGIKRKLPQNFQQFYGGNTWWSLTRNSLRYAIDYTDTNPNFFNRFKHTFCAEEIFFQTILLNSPFKQNVVSNNLRYSDWERRNGNRPANLDDTDFNILMTSDKIFARKFIYPLGQNLLERLKMEVLK